MAENSSESRRPRTATMAWRDEDRDRFDRYDAYGERSPKRRRIGDSPPLEPAAPTTLRLIAKPSSRSSLENDRIVALCDPQTTTAIGRDRAFGARLRLPELAVSKTHAQLFWLRADRDGEASWAVVDLGSQHGTFVQRAGDDEWRRLSEPRVASKPVRLRHLDRLKVCSTTFTAHVHHPPCDVCCVAVDSSNVIPTINEPASAAAAAHEAAIAERAPSLQSSTREQRHETMKRDMKSLRALLMAKPDRPGRPVAVASAAPQYVDRARLRREMHGDGDHADAPRPPAVAVYRPPPVSPTRLAPAPAPPPLESTRGYGLLSKLGGGVPLGELAAPVEARTLGADRAGLGSRLPVSAHDYGAAGLAEHSQRRRRWGEVDQRVE